MKRLGRVTSDEVLQCFCRENDGSDGTKKSASFDWTKDRLRELERVAWEYVMLSREDILNITNPAHKHGWDLESGTTVMTAAARLPRRGECWDNVASHRERDFSKTHVFLRAVEGRLTHIDGFHRLLAWVVFEKQQDVPAYVATVEQGEV